MTGLGIRAPLQPLDKEHVARLGGHMGVYEIASPAGEVIFIGFAGGRSVFGLRGELGDRLAEENRRGATFRCEITTAYLSRYKELLMIHAARHGSLPSENLADAPELGRLSPA